MPYPQIGQGKNFERTDPPAKEKAPRIFANGRENLNS